MITHRRSLAFDPIASTTFPLNVLFCFEKSSDRLFVSAHREESPIVGNTVREDRGQVAKVTPHHRESYGKEEERRGH